VDFYPPKAETLFTIPYSLYPNFFLFLMGLGIYLIADCDDYLSIAEFEKVIVCEFILRWIRVFLVLATVFWMRIIGQIVLIIAGLIGGLEIKCN